MNQLCKSLEEIEYGKVDDNNSKKHQDGNEKEKTINNLHKAMDTYFHDFVKQLI